MNCHFVIKCFRLAPSCHLCHWEDGKQHRSELGHLKGGSRGNFMLQHPLLLHWRSSVHLPSCHHSGNKIQNKEQIARSWVRQLFALKWRENIIYWSAKQNLVIGHRKTLLRNMRNCKLSGSFEASCSLLYFFINIARCKNSESPPEKKGMCSLSHLALQRKNRYLNYWSDLEA